MPQSWHHWVLGQCVVCYRLDLEMVPCYSCLGLRKGMRLSARSLLGVVSFCDLPAAPYVSFRGWEGQGVLLWHGLHNPTVGLWASGSPLLILPCIGKKLLPAPSQFCPSRLPLPSPSPLLMCPVTALFNSSILLDNVFKMWLSIFVFSK